MEAYTIYLPNRKAKTYWVDIIFVLFGIFWIILGNYGLGIILVIMSCIGFYANRKRVITFTKEHIEYPSLIPKVYQWVEVENVILKDDIITIDLKDNRIRQSLIDKIGNAGLDTVQFNSFCQALLTPQSVIQAD